MKAKIKLSSFNSTIVPIPENMKNLYTSVFPWMEKYRDETVIDAIVHRFEFQNGLKLTTIVMHTIKKRKLLKAKQIVQVSIVDANDEMLVREDFISKYYKVPSNEFDLPQSFEIISNVVSGFRAVADTKKAGELL